jgi:hypothetical protein
MLKSHNLYKDTNGPLTQEQQAQFELIDRVKTEGMIHAEKKMSIFVHGRGGLQSRCQHSQRPTLRLADDCP